MDIKLLTQYENEGWLYSQHHPSLPLIIWNYSQSTQFEGFWNDITLATRGLVTDESGNVVARPFKKFFNIEEGRFTPTPDYKVFEKMDGSLGILFYYNDEWIFATRGSFTSDQAIRGRQILNKYKYRYLPTDTTYLFEIIYGNSILETIDIELENGNVIRYLFDDIVKTSRGYIKAIDLDIDDEIII